MFEKLFILVKNNAGRAIIDNPVIPAKFHDAVINDASSSIIEVLKSQVENGLLKDLVKYFQFSGIYNNPLISSAVNKFANKLNNFYNVEPKAALATAKALIPPVMQELIHQSKSQHDTDFALSTLLSKLNGNNVSMNTLLNHMTLAS
ncbi:MAG: hypothetical protein JWR67_1257 [Mucilaginibacter sp.]|nr:hypothetical protein [Mucilaginibacter sp.]MDB5110143.1 hypothetical protein [Mucilaginibacter sp.]